MREDDLVRLRHMLDAARDVISFTRDTTRKTLDSDRKLTLSLVKSIEIVGEAASKVSKQAQQQCPKIPWADIVAMRNRLIHTYYDIDLDRVWDTVISDLPPLITELEKLIPKR